MQPSQEANTARKGWFAALVAAGLCCALTGCSNTTNGSAQAGGATGQAPAASTPTASASPSTTATPTASLEMRGNAATNPACTLLSIDQVAAISGLAVTALLGLPGTNRDGKRSESCTWYLDPKYVQSSLVVQYTVFDKPPTDLTTYYAQVIKQGYYKKVPNLGDIAKIDKHVIDAIYKRASMSVTLLVHAEATPEDQAASIELMRLVMKGVAQ